MKEEMEKLINLISTTADIESMQGRFEVSAVLLSARQAIRVLWTKLEDKAEPDIKPAKTNGKHEKASGNPRLSSRT